MMDTDDATRTKRRSAALKANATKGEAELRRAARKAAWTRKHGEDDANNPHSRPGAGARFVLKPVLWNTAGYRRPSGVKATNGFPKAHGFGHEEWNNSPDMAFEESGQKLRAFHTENVGSLPFDANAGRFYVFMYASHDGVRELVGVAGNATCLIPDEEARTELARRLRLDRLREDAWAVHRVKECYNGSRSMFTQAWRDEVIWIPNWTCPERLFFWPERPIRLEARRITGTSKLLTSLGRYTEVDRRTAKAVLRTVPSAARTPAWSALAQTISGAEKDGDTTDAIKAAAADAGAGSVRGTAAAPLTPGEADAEPFDPDGITDARETVAQQINARRGQQAFRDKLLAAYDGRCAITGCPVVDVLEAAHIHPYRGGETNHVANGLLLRADLHTLLDCGLLAVNPDSLRVVLAPSTRGSTYGKLHGRALRPRKAGWPGPSVEALRLRFEVFGRLHGRDR